MNKKQPPAPRRRPTQSRSRVLVKAIIEACQQVLQKEGSDQLTTKRIAEVAGITIGSLYQYFPNKEAILAKLFSETIAAQSEQISREATERVVTQSNISLRSTIAELIRINAELHLRYLELHGDFYRQYHDFFDFHSAVNEVTTGVYQQPSWEDWLPKLLSKYRKDIVVNDIEQAAFITGNMIDRLLAAALEKNPDWLSDPGYLNNLERAVINYLCTNH
jgi:AcrR family transcriptional regulator